MCVNVCKLSSFDEPSHFGLSLFKKNKNNNKQNDVSIFYDLDFSMMISK